jgi:hypothetical protein
MEHEHLDFKIVMDDGPVLGFQGGNDGTERRNWTVRCGVPVLRVPGILAFLEIEHLNREIDTVLGKISAQIGALFARRERRNAQIAAL